MKAETYPLRVLLVAVAGWVNRHQQQVIEYLVEENRVLREQLGGKRLRLTNDQRRRLAAKGKRLGRKTLNRVATIVTPDTIMRWYRRLIALKWTFSQGRVGRPGLMRKIARLIVRMATENSNWGYCRIQGELKHLGHRVARSTIANVLKENGIRPAPDRPTSWRTFIQAHWGQLAGMDFFTTEVWTPRGLVTYYILFVIELKSRRVSVAAVTQNPSESLMTRVALNYFTDCVDGFLKGLRFVICDRDTKFSARFGRVLSEAGIELIRTPYQAPNCNAYAERFVHSIKSECLDRMIFFAETSLRKSILEYTRHYHWERARQGLENRRIEILDATTEGPVHCRERLGGMLKHYYRAA